MPARKEKPGVDIRKDYDHDDRAHELVRDVYTLATGIDPVPIPEQHPSRHGTVATSLAEPEPQDQPAESAGQTEAADEGQKRKKTPAKKPVKRTKVMDPADEVVKDLGRDEDPSDDDNKSIAETRSKRAAASSTSKSNSKTTPDARGGRNTRSTRSTTAAQRQAVKGTHADSRPAPEGTRVSSENVPPRQRAPPAVSPIPSASSPSIAPPDTGIPIQVSLAYNLPQNIVGRTLTTSLSNIDTFPKLLRAFHDTFRREVASLGGLTRLNVLQVLASAGAGEGIRYVDVTVTSRYLEWVQLMETASTLQGPDLARGSLVLVVQRGGEGTDSWGDAPGWGPSWGKKDENGNEGREDQMPPPPSKRSKNSQIKAKSAQKGASKGAAKTTVRGSSHAREQEGPESSQTPEASFQHVWDVFRGTEQQRRRRPRSFVFTKSEEETDEEEMVEVPRAYLERLEIGGLGKGLISKGEIAGDKEDRERRAANRRFFEAQV